MKTSPVEFNFEKSKVNLISIGDLIVKVLFALCDQMDIQRMQNSYQSLIFVSLEQKKTDHPQEQIPLDALLDHYFQILLLKDSNKLFSF